MNHTAPWGGMRSWSSAPRAAGRSFLVHPSRDTHGFAPCSPCVQQGRRLRSARTGHRLDLLCSRRTVHTCKRTATRASGLHTSSIWIQLRSILTMKCRSVRRPSRPPVVARSASAISAVADIRDLISLEDVTVLARAARVIGARRPMPRADADADMCMSSRVGLSGQSSDCIMNELNYGPNGGLIYCMEYLIDRPRRPPKSTERSTEGTAS